MSRLLVSVIALCACCCWIGETRGEGKKYAILVGVKSYRPGQPLSALSYSENDAQRLAEVLELSGYSVVLMTQASSREEGREIFAPNADFIRDQLDPLLNNPFLSSDDVVIIALAGHGVQYEWVESDAAASRLQRFYFCPADADLRNHQAAATETLPPLQTANEIDARNHLIDLGELYARMEKCKAGGKLLLVDACRNDPSRESGTRAAQSRTLPAVPPPPGGVAAFFSCSAHQKAFEDVDLQHGVFFHYVIDALQGSADTQTARKPADGKITLAELHEHVSGSVYDYVRSKYGGAAQAPELKGTFRGVIPLVDLSATPASVASSVARSQPGPDVGGGVIGSARPSVPNASRLPRPPAGRSMPSSTRPPGFSSKVLTHEDRETILKNLRVGDEATVKSALMKLSQYTPETPDNLMSVTVAKFLTNRDRGYCAAAAKALVNWATNSSTNDLLEAMQDRNLRNDAMVALGRLQAKAAIAPTVALLDDPFARSSAKKALIAHGSGAERPVLMLLEKSRDGQTQQAACNVLKFIGTEASIPALKSIANQDTGGALNFFVRKEAQEALSEIVLRQ